MTVSQSQEVGTGDVGILVDLVRIVGRETCLCSERELGNYVSNLGLLLRRIVRRLLCLQSP